MKGPQGAAARRATRALAALAVLATVSALAPGADARQPTPAFNVTAHDDGLAFWFEVDGLPGRNPTIPVDPGATVTIHLRNNGTVRHDFWAHPLGGVPCCLEPGATGNGTFIAPMSDTGIPYHCTLHKGAGMAGRFTVGAGVDTKTPLPAWAAFGGVALAALLRFRKPFAHA